jgi:hypothetical protein
MENRLVITSLCAAAIVYACGPWMHLQSASPSSADAQSQHVSHSASPNVTRSVSETAGLTTTPSHTTRGAHRTTGSIATALDITRTGSRVDFALRIVNNTPKTVELRFPTARTHDFAVVDSTGRTVWRASDGRLYTQTMQAMAVRSRDTLTLGESWDARNAHGSYTAVALLATDTHPVEQRVPFRLP